MLADISTSAVGAPRNAKHCSTVSIMRLTGAIAGSTNQATDIERLTGQQQQTYNT